LVRLSALSFLSVIVVACVGNDPVATSGSSGTSGSGTSGSSGTVDSGADASGGGGRSISCDATSTCTNTQKCCGVGTDWINASCKDDCGAAYELACDDAADCGTGKVCCAVTDGGARVTRSYCKASCAAAETQLCDPGADKECTSPASCTPFVNWSPSGLSRCQ